MQTFLPFKSFSASAAYLDRQRLGKQRVEVYQILRALTGVTKGWTNHPATKMWRGHINALVRYGEAICNEWIMRGYKDTMLDKIRSFKNDETGRPPAWLGDERLHSSHRANLARKDPDQYGLNGHAGWSDDPDMPYYWPV